MMSRARSARGALDDLIVAAELCVVRRDHRVRRNAQLFGQELRLAGRRTAEGVAAGALVIVVAVALSRLVRRRPAARPTRVAAPNVEREPAGRWIQLLPLVWPWLPVPWRSQLPLGAAMALAGALNSLVRRNRR